MQWDGMLTLDQQNKLSLEESREYYRRSMNWHLERAQEERRKIRAIERACRFINPPPQKAPARGQKFLFDVSSRGCDESQKAPWEE